MPDNFKKITAPYNFVPLSGWVFQPKWASQVSHDLPFSEGLSGSLDIEITAEKPILVGGKQIKATAKDPGEVHFFQLPNNDYAIPGTSIKGMIRSVLEIASFGKMQFVDDRRLSIRDISNKGFIGDNYQISGQKAGFLRLCDDSKVEIIPCKAAYVEHKDMKTLLNKKPEKILEVQLSHITAYKRQKTLQYARGKYIFKRGMSVAEKYAIWQDITGKSYDDLPTLSFDRLVSGGQMETAKNLKYGNKGILVFTSQISDKGQNESGKYRDFVFFDRQSQPLKVSPSVFKDFLYIHGDEDKNSSSSWQNYWRDIFFKSDRHEIPVFYHVDENEQVKSIGLAYMYRLAYHNSIGESIDYTNKKHRNPDGYDLADLLFGKVHPDDNKSQQSLKSRVNFGIATLQGTPQFAEERYSEATILNGPKPTYFPNYVRQTDVEKVIDKKSPYKLRKDKQYRTYMQPDSEIRGWKRYPVRRWERLHLQVIKGKQLKNKKVQVKLFPLQEKSKFKSTIRFHNLLPKELGALIWTLTWGNNDKFSHSLGMGKSFGFGQVSIKIIGSDIRSPKQEKIKFDEKHYIELFKTLMETEYVKAQNNTQAKWEDSEQIKQLTAMADPEHSQTTANDLKHMELEEQLENGRKRNQFVKAKQNGWVLHEYSCYGDDAKLFPRTPIKQHNKPKPATPELDSEQEVSTEIDQVQQWIETSIQTLKKEKRIATTTNKSDSICSKALAEKWQTIDDEAFKREVRDEISRHWTNMSEYENVDYWKVPPTASMKRIRKIYDKG